MILANILGILVVILLIIASYCFIKDQSRDIVSCVLDKIMIFKRKKKKDETTQEDDSVNTPDETKSCEFEGEDMYNGMVFSVDGTPVKEQPQMTCADCTKYIYKDSEGKCYDFIHDTKYNADNYCSEEQKEEGEAGKRVTLCNDVCTASFTPRACPF